MLLVGLTGGLASGKSTVARMLQRRGAVVVDADELAGRALRPGTPELRRVVEAFGDEVLASDGRLDRHALAGLVFADERKRRTLEAIVHPKVFRLLGEVLERYDGTDTVVVFDAPLIVETGFDERCDALVVVSAPAEEQVARVARERGMSPADARGRIEAQTSPGEREARADVVIRNDATLEELERQVEGLWGALRERAGKQPT